MRRHMQSRHLELVRNTCAYAVGIAAPRSHADLGMVCRRVLTNVLSDPRYANTSRLLPGTEGLDEFLNFAIWFYIQILVIFRADTAVL